MKERKYLPTLSELIDRLSIIQLKEVFIPEHKTEYANEIKDIVHDIDILLKKSVAVLEDESCGTQLVAKVEERDTPMNAEMIRAIIVLAQMNLHIWTNESEARKGNKDGNKLLLTHSLNGIRCTAKNKIQESVGGISDYKIDCLAAEYCAWEVSW